MYKFVVMLTVIFVCTLLPVVAQEHLYVSPDGSGSVFSGKNPGSLSGVNDKINEIRSKRPQTIYIHMAAGVYPLSQTLLLSWQSREKDTSRVVFMGAPDQKTILSGAMEIKNWTPAGNGIYKATVPRSVAFRQLYVNGKMAVRARFPNRSNENDFGPYFRVSRFDVAGKKICITAAELPAMKNQDGVELVTNQHWYQSRVRIDKTEKLKDSVFISAQQPEGAIFWGMTSYNMHLPGKPFYFENARELLDTAGEWYLDRREGVVYYKPLAGENPAQLSVAVPVLETLLQVQGTGAMPLANLSMENIHFQYTTWLQPDRRGSIATQAVQQRNFEDSSGTGMIQVAFARNFTLTQCTVTGAGAHGLVFQKGVQNSNVIRNHFNQICANAIVIDTDKKFIQHDSIHCTRNTIAYNLIENIGMHFTNGMGILASNVSKHLIAHNEIRYGRYSGMQIGNHYGDNLSRLRDNRIEANNIHHVMLLHDDGGAIYTLSNQPGTKILRNWIHDYNKCQWADSYPVNGIFLDNNSSYILVENNVFSNLKEVDRLKENIGTTIHDNEFRNNSSQDQEVMKAAGIGGLNE